MTSPIPSRIVLATRNMHKVGEIAALLPASLNIELLSLADIPDAPEIVEDADSFAGNAALKAIGISRVVDAWVLADDSGLCVDALGGAPGIYSARFAGEHGDDAANNAELVRQLSALPGGSEPFRAHFACALSLAREGEEVAAFEGRVEGHISCESAGSGGFGYDPLFIPEGEELSFGQLPDEVKNSMSHRARALQQLQDYFASLQA